jgi:hypothetical protein
MPGGTATLVPFQGRGVGLADAAADAVGPLEPLPVALAAALSVALAAAVADAPAAPEGVADAVPAPDT